MQGLDALVVIAAQVSGACARHESAPMDTRGAWSRQTYVLRTGPLKLYLDGEGRFARG